MKRKIWVYSCVLLLSIVLYNSKCEDIIVKINNIEKEKSIAVHKEKNMNISSETKNKNKKNIYVSVLIKNKNNNSIYHNNIHIKNKNIIIYYGKNFKYKKSCNLQYINSSCKYFKKSNCIKIYSKEGIKFACNNTSIRYRGTFILNKTGSGVVIINRLLLEDYVAGVISSEIGCQAPIEALKAQAVCARTYLLKSDSKKYKKFKATVDDSTDFQVYNKTQPNKKCYKAAKDTKGIVLKYNNCLINAYYFSTSCGYTTDYRIWGTKKKKYLQSVNLNNGEYKNIKTEDGFKNYILNNSDGIEREYPYYRWNVTLSDLQIQNAIYGLTKVNIGKIQSINVIKRGEGGIAAQIVVKGDMKQIIIRNQNEIRNAFCSVYANIKLNNGETVSGMTMLPSAFIYIEKVKAGYKIYGGGYGHGSGMSQNAAIVMAKNGVKYDEILKKFYINAELKSY